MVWHIISEDGTRAGGNVPRSMIDAQINVLNQAFGGYTGGAASRFEFKTKKINRVINPQLVADPRRRTTSRRSRPSSR